MKKVISLAVGAVAMVALSGCNPDSVINKIDVQDLKDGYGIAGDGSRGKRVAIEFCQSSYEYYRGGNYIEAGTFNIVNGAIQLSKVDMHPNGGGSSYAIETDTGYFVRGDAYEVAGVETIDPLDDIYKIPCP